MKPYLDTSAIVAAFTIESATPRVNVWLSDNQHRAPAISEWVITEFHAALSMKVRRGELNDYQRDTALIYFKRVVVNNIETITVTSAHFNEAARMSNRYRTGLRAGDALHLAICGTEGLALCTLDVGQADAGRSLGVSTNLL